MDEAVGEPIWSLPPDTLKLTQALPSPGWGGRCQAEFTQVAFDFSCGMQWLDGEAKDVTERDRELFESRELGLRPAVFKFV